MCMHMPKHTCVPEDTVWVLGIKLRYLVLAATFFTLRAISLALHALFPVLNLLGEAGLEGVLAFPKLIQLSTW